MLLDDSDSHNVEYSTGVSVLRVRELFVTPALIVCGLNLAVDLPATSAVQINAIFPMGDDRAVDDRISRFLLSDLLDVKSFSSLMSKVARISAIMSWTETFLGGGPEPFFPVPDFSFTGPPPLILP